MCGRTWPIETEVKRANGESPLPNGSTPYMCVPVSVQPFIGLTPRCSSGG